MADDLPEDSPRVVPAKSSRPAPTLDLEAEKISESAAPPNADAAIEDDGTSPPRHRPRATGAIVGGAVAGALAAAAIVAGWMWNETHKETTPPVSQATFNDLTTRLSALESKLAKPPATTLDPAIAARLDTVEKSFASLKSGIASAQQRSDQLATAVNEARASSPAPVAVDLGPLDNRIALIERNIGAFTAEQAQRNATPPDDKALRRAVAASLLDGAVRLGEPFDVPLTAAKSLAPGADALNVLTTFASSGVPSAPAMCRELLTLLPQLSPAPETSSIGAGIVDRLKADAVKLVRIQRTDSVSGGDKSAVAGRATSAAVRNDLAEAARELNTLDPADRAPVQPWLNKVAAREAAFAASRQFTADAVAALGKATTQ